MIELITNYTFILAPYLSADFYRIILAIAFLFSFKHYNIYKDKIVLGIATFILYAIVRTCFVTDISSALEEIYILLFAWFLPFIMGLCINNDKHREKVVIITIYVFTLVVIAGVLSYYNIIPDKIFGIRLTKYGMLWCASEWHLPFAARANFIFIISLCLILFSNINKNIKIFLSIFCIILFSGICLSTSRTHICLSLFSLFIIMLIYVIKFKKYILCLSILLTIILFGYTIYVFNPNVKNKIEKTSINKDVSLIVRKNLVKYGLNLYTNYPLFGIGPEQVKYQKGYSSLLLDGNKHHHVHNIYVNMLVSYGAIGFIVFIFIIFNIIKQLLLSYTKTRNIFVFSILFAWIILLLGENFDCLLKDNLVSSLYFWFTGLALSKQQKQIKK